VIFTDIFHGVVNRSRFKMAWAFNASLVSSVFFLAQNIKHSLSMDVPDELLAEAMGIYHPVVRVAQIR
jgi:uncharacterized membrane protein